MGEGGVKKPGKSGDVLYGWPLRVNYLFTNKDIEPSPMAVDDQMRQFNSTKVFK